jgi:membrane associated rhomboid family serine protease
MNDIFSDFRNAFRHKNNGLMKIIVINVVVFLVLAFLNVVLWLAEQNNILKVALDWIALSPDIMKFVTRPWTLITYGFTHDLTDIFHILFNMLILYWMGRLVQDFVGSGRVVAIYLLGVIVGALFFFAFYNLIPRLIDQQGYVRLVGASGGVYAIIVAAATLAPDTIVLLFGIFPVRLKYIAWFSILVSFLALASPNTGGNAAHLGGALIGYIFIGQLRKGRDLGKPINQFLQWWASLFQPKPKMKVTYVREKAKVTKTATQAKQNKAEQMIASGTVPSQEELDRILDKISEKGYDSLTKEEKQKLFDASRGY